jgi:hypothetical protein
VEKPLKELEEQPKPWTKPIQPVILEILSQVHNITSLHEQKLTNPSHRYLAFPTSSFTDT